MKKARIILTVIIVGMIAVGWFNQFMQIRNHKQTYNEFVEEADKCAEEKLYKKSIALYEKALSVKENPKIRDSWLDSYKKGLEENEISSRDYVKALDRAVEVHPDLTILWEALLEETINVMDYDDAMRYYKHALSADVDEEELAKYKNDIIYAIEENNRIFSDVIMSSKGYFTVHNENNWGIIDPSGKWLYECEYLYASPMINKDIYLLATSKDTRIYDKDKIAQAIIDEKDYVTKAVSEDILPICKDHKWKFYDYNDKKYILDTYDDVSCFTQGCAVVKCKDQWTIIDKEGSKVSEQMFDDVKLLGTGEYLIDKVMIASVDGKYGIYDQKGKKTNDFSASDMDVYMGEYIAYKNSKGKWGFVDAKGRKVIECIFDEAKSFSNGLAAVRSGDKWGFIDKKGEVVIDYQYADGGYFNKKGVCFVGYDKEQKYMISLRFN